VAEQLGNGVIELR